MDEIVFRRIFLIIIALWFLFFTDWHLRSSLGKCLFFCHFQQRTITAHFTGRATQDNTTPLCFPPQQQARDEGERTGWERAIGCTLATLGVEREKGGGLGCGGAVGGVVCVNWEREILKCGTYTHPSCLVLCGAWPWRPCCSPSCVSALWATGVGSHGCKRRGRPWLRQPPMLAAQQGKEEDDGALFSSHPPHHR